MRNNQALGKRGEELAKVILKDEGYEIIMSNFKCYYGEIDIIAKKDKKIAFVEVKTRTTGTFGMPADAVDRKKRKKISAASKYFLSIYGEEYETVDFQVMEIMVRHTENLDFREGGHAI